MSALTCSHVSEVSPEVVEDYTIANTENVLSVLNGGMEITPYHHCRRGKDVLASDLARRGNVVFLLSALSASIQSLVTRYQELTSFFQMSVDAFFLPHDYAQWRERGRKSKRSGIGWNVVQRCMAEIVMYLSTNDFAAAMDTIDQAFYTLCCIRSIPLQLEAIATARQFPEVGASERAEV